MAVLNGAHFLDSAFDVACVRAKRGGKLLANMLMHRTHGDRPVTLLGVSLGARLAFHCCLELHKHGARAHPPLCCSSRETRARRSVSQCLCQHRVLTSQGTTTCVLMRVTSHTRLHNA